VGWSGGLNFVSWKNWRGADCVEWMELNGDGSDVNGGGRWEEGSGIVVWESGSDRALNGLVSGGRETIDGWVCVIDGVASTCDVT
jgi:hypothetical protein